MAAEQQKEWTGKSRGGGFGYAFFVFLIRYCGIRSAYLFLAFVVCYFIPFAPRATAAVWDYYRHRRRYGRLRAAAALYRHYYRFGQTLIDRIAIRAGMEKRYRFSFDNYDAFMELLRSGSGVVMIGAHVGCWEAGSRFFGQYEGRLNVVMYDAEWARIRQVVEQHTDMRNYRVIPVNGPSLDAALKIKVALNAGEPVCFQGDRFLSEERTLSTRFMGAEARFPEGPFLLAAKLRTPVVFYFAMREAGRRYRFLFTLVGAEEHPTREELLERYVGTLEGVLDRYPEQWYNFYKFWA